MKKTVFALVFSSAIVLSQTVFAEDALYIDADGKVGIGTAEPEDKLDVNGQTRSHSNIIYHYSTDAPSDLWGGPYLINQTGFIGHMGNYALDIVWNGYRRTPDNKYNVLGINGSDTINAIRLDDSGICFDSQDSMSNGNSKPVTRMFVSKNGNVGIGTTSPSTKLDIRGMIRQVAHSNYDVWIQGGASTGSGDARNLAVLGMDEDYADRLYINYNSEYSNGTIIGGPVGIGRSPTYTLDVNGLLRVYSTLYYSDERMKKNIKNIDSSLKQLSRVRGVSYQWNDAMIGEKKHFGVLASEIEEIFPELVYTDEEGIKSVDYVGMIAPMIEAMKELKAENDELKKQNSMLEDRMSKIEALLAELAPKRNAK